MTDIVLLPITNSANVSVVNDNNAKIQQSINEDILHLVGGNNTMLQQLDMNSNKIINIQTDPNDPDSMVTVGAGDSRWYNVAGDTLTGTMNTGGQRIINLPVPMGATEPVRKGEYDSQLGSITTTIIANKAQSVRAPDGEAIPSLPPAGSRANKVMGFDALGNPIGTLPLSGSGTELAIDLANSVDPLKGSGMIGWKRTVLSEVVTRVGHMLSAQRVRAEEFADLAGGYVKGGDPLTWDWAPAINAALTFAGTSGNVSVVELPSIDLRIGTKSLLPPPFTDASIRGYGLRIPSNVTLQGTGATRLVQTYLGTSASDRIAMLMIAGSTNAGISDIAVVGSLSAVGLTYGLQMVNSSRNWVRNLRIQDTSFSGISCACIEGALVSGEGTSHNVFSNVTIDNTGIDSITLLNGPGVNDVVPTRAPLGHNTFYSLTIKNGRVDANNVIAIGIRRSNYNKFYDLKIINMPEGGVVIESGASYNEIHGLFSDRSGLGSGAAVILHYHVSDGDSLGNFLPGVGNKVFGGVILNSGRAFLHKGDYDTLHTGITIVGSTFRAVGTDNVDTSAGSVANPAINPMRITYSDSTFDGLFNVDTSLGNTGPGLTFGHGSGHKVTGGRISNFKVGISDSGDANVYSDIAFTRNERDVSTPNTTSKAIVRNCGANLNSTVVQQNVALAGLIRPTDAAFGAFNSGVASLGTDPTSIGNDDIVAIVTATNRGFATIPAFGYVGYPATSLQVKIRAKATGGSCSVSTQLIANGVAVSSQASQNVPVGGWAWYTFIVPINTLVDVANCAWNLRSGGAMSGTLSIDAFKLDVV